MATIGSRQYLEVDLRGPSEYGPFTEGATASPQGENNSFARGEINFGTLNTTPIWRGVPIIEDGFNLWPTAQRAAENLKRNIQNQAPPTLTGFDVNGTINALAAPLDKRFVTDDNNARTYQRSLLAWMLGAGLNRKANELRSYSMRWVTPDISVQTFTGCKINVLNIEADKDAGTLTFSADWLGASHSPAADPGNLVTPRFPRPGARVLNDTSENLAEVAVGWTFSRAQLWLGDQTGDASAATGERFLIANVRSITISNNNNLDPQATVVRTVLDGVTGCPTEEFVITGFREQASEISGTMVVDYIDVNNWQRLNDDSLLMLGISGRHPQSGIFGVSAGIPAAPFDFRTAQTLTVADNEGNYCVGRPTTTPATADYALVPHGAVLVENQAVGLGGVANYEYDVVNLDNTGLVTAVTATITLDGSNTVGENQFWNGFGQSFTSATSSDYVLYDNAVGIKVTGVKLDSANLTGGPTDIIGQELQFTAGQFGSEPSAITWTASEGGYAAVPVT
jgi:hypothetical protein